MFTRAGFNPYHDVVCRALVRVAGRRIGDSYLAKLIRFRPSGELAWYSRAGRFLVWPDKITVESVIDVHSLRVEDPALRAVSIAAYHSKLAAAREAGCLAVAG